jgi:uncharacterized damage-inducible protein DinB
MPAPTSEFAVTYCQMMLDGLTNEVEITKRVLAAVPESQCDNYRPDPNARNARELAWHIANTDIQFLDSIADLKFTMDTPEGADKPRTIAEIVAWYDRNFKRASDRVRAMSPEQLATPVDFMGLFNLPAAFYLGFLNNHCIHHRGELATYLRPMGSKIPSIYGGSYDEPFQPVQAETAA